MSAILSEIYLTDAYARANDEFARQTDSVLMYKPIFEKYGCTLEEYQRSLKHYIANNDAYFKILDKAEQLLKSHLAMIGGAGNGGDNLWIADSLVIKGAQQIADNPRLRALHWLLAQDADYSCTMADKCSTDLPQNSEWWQNNLPAKKSENSLMNASATISGRAFTSNRKALHPDTLKESDLNKPAGENKPEEIKKDFMKGAAHDGTIDKTVKMPRYYKGLGKISNEERELIRKEAKEEKEDKR